MIDLNQVTLEPEQLFISNYLTVQHDGIDNIFVQGVAGSGKTTIALKIIENLIEYYKNANQDMPTILLITYNEKLVSYCKEALINNSLTSNYINQTSDIRPNLINIKRLIDLLIEPNHEKFLDDDAAIKAITKLRKDFIKLRYTSNQIFRAIGYLKGMSQEEIEQLKINLPEDESEILENVKNYFLNKYKNFLKNNKLEDRSDRVDFMLEIFNEITKYRDILNGNIYTKEKIKLNTDKTLGDKDKFLKNFFIWLDLYLEFLEKQDNDSGISQFRTELKNKSLKNWNSLCQVAQNGLKKYGFYGNEKIERITNSIINPLFIIDEIQDFTINEIKLLLQLWYLLPRKSYKNKIIFLGDLNQMITPTGFSWGILHKEVSKYSKIYDNKTIPALSFVDDNNKKLKNPYHRLENNYRTTPEMSKFVYNFVSTLFSSILIPKEFKIIKKDLINPLKTKPRSFMEIYQRMNTYEKVPKIFVGSLHTLKKAILLVLEEINNTQFKKQNTIQRLIILNSYEELENDLQFKEKLRGKGELIPIAQAKGLEFLQIIISGLKRSGANSFNKQDINLWYMTITRAQAKELIFFVKEDFEFFNNQFNKKIENVGAIVERLNDEKDDIEKLRKAILQIGHNKINFSQAEQLAELNFKTFLISHNVKDLEQSLEYLTYAKATEKYIEFANTAAIIFEELKQYDKALTYFEKGQDFVGAIRQLYHIHELNPDFGYKTLYTKLLAQIKSSAELVDAYLIWSDFLNAFKEIFKIKDKNNFNEKYEESLKALKRKIDKIDNHQELIDTIAVIESNKKYEDASDLCVLINQPLKAVETVLKGDKYVKAKEIASKLGNSPQGKECWRTLLNYQLSLEKKDRLELYYIYDKLKNEKEKLVIENWLMENGKYLLLVDAYFSVGNKNPLKLKYLKNNLYAAKKFVDLAKVHLKLNEYNEATLILNRIYNIFLIKMQNMFYPQIKVRENSEVYLTYELKNYFNFIFKNATNILNPNDLEVILDDLKKFINKLSEHDYETEAVTELKNLIDKIWNSRTQSENMIQNWSNNYKNLLHEVTTELDKLYEGQIPAKFSIIKSELEKKEIKKRDDFEEIRIRSFNLIFAFKYYISEEIGDRIKKEVSIKEALKFWKDIARDENKFKKEIEKLKYGRHQNYLILLDFFSEYDYTPTQKYFFKFLKGEKHNLEEILSEFYADKTDLFKDHFLLLKKNKHFDDLISLFETTAQKIGINIDSIHELNLSQLMAQMGIFINQIKDENLFFDYKRLKQKIENHKNPQQRWKVIVEDYPQIKKFKYFVQLNNKINARTWANKYKVS